MHIKIGSAPGQCWARLRVAPSRSSGCPDHHRLAILGAEDILVSLIERRQKLSPAAVVAQLHHWGPGRSFLSMRLLSLAAVVLASESWCWANGSGLSGACGVGAPSAGPALLPSLVSVPDSTGSRLMEHFEFPSKIPLHSSERFCRQIVTPC